MSRTPSFENHLNDWLEDGPADAPDRVLDTVLAAFPSIPQRRAALRVPWRFPPMTGYTRAAAAIAAAVAIVAIGFTFAHLPSTDVGGASPPASVPPAVSSPSPVPSPSAEPSASPVAIDTSGWKTFVSTRYGASVRHPVDWTVRPATATWPAGVSALALTDKMVDTITSPNGVTVQVASQRLPAGVTDAAWLTSYEASGPAANPSQFTASCWPAPEKMDRTRMGGQAAWLHSGCGFDEAVGFFAGRVYIVSLWSEPFYNYQLFLALLSTVRFEPVPGG